MGVIGFNIKKQKATNAFGLGLELASHGVVASGAYETALQNGGPGAGDLRPYTFEKAWLGFLAPLAVASFGPLKGGRRGARGSP